MLEPYILTERLILRSFKADDASQVQSLYGDWEVLKLLLDEPYPYPEGAAARWLAQHEKMRAAGIHYPLAIELGGLCIGYVGLRPKKDQTCVIGYWLGYAYWGRGLMSEAVTSTVKFGFETLPIDQMVARHREDNLRSGRILNKLSFFETRREVVFSPSCKTDCVAVCRVLKRQDWDSQSL